MPHRQPRTRTLARRGDLIAEVDPRRPSGRLLRQAGMEASYVDLADAMHLEFDYMCRLRIALQAAVPAACCISAAALARSRERLPRRIPVDARRCAKSTPTARRRPRAPGRGVHPDCASGTWRAGPILSRRSQIKAGMRS